MKIVRCYFPCCDQNVVGIITPRKNPQNQLFVCQHHYDELSKVYIDPEYEEGSGWFQSLTDIK